MVDQKFRKNEVVVRKGQDKGGFYVVLRGKMKVTEIAVGDQSFDDVVLMPGDFFGEHALIMDAPPSANLIGLEDGWCFGIDKETFDKTLGSFSRFSTKARDKQRLVRFLHLFCSDGIVSFFL